MVLGARQRLNGAARSAVHHRPRGRATCLWHHHSTHHGSRADLLLSFLCCLVRVVGGSAAGRLVERRRTERPRPSCRGAVGRTDDPVALHPAAARRAETEGVARAARGPQQVNGAGRDPRRVRVTAGVAGGGQRGRSRVKGGAGATVHVQRQVADAQVLTLRGPWRAGYFAAARGWARRVARRPRAGPGRRVQCGGRVERTPREASAL
mmetsp:Transcript_134825/g.305241  ORF Transcript_134825/g.305241 Transcript_134825/m.305241 type:complete len:208 (-) Transcript_134825:11-634(-)